MVVEPGDSALSVTHDGGKTWRTESVANPANCKDCRAIYRLPKFASSNDAAVAVTFADDSVQDGRFVNTTHLTHDGGISWKITDSFEQLDPHFGKTGMAANVGTDVIRIFSGSHETLQIRSAGVSINSSVSSVPRRPKELSGEGMIAGADFYDSSNGWLIYHTDVCAKVRNRDSDGPGVPCLSVIQRNEVVATSDGGRTIQMITPRAAELPTQGQNDITP